MVTRKPLVVYTAIVDGKDLLMPPLQRMEGVDYICFTNTPKYCHAGFENRPLPFDEGSARMSARKIKILAHQLFPEYERSVWIDGTKQILRDLTPLLEKAFAKDNIAAFSHAERTCLYDEIDACIRYGRERPEKLQQQKEQYQQMSIPANWGLPTSYVLFRAHHDEAVKAAMEEWWQHITQFSQRDQISLPVALMKQDCPITYLDPSLHDEFFIHRSHLWQPKGDSRNRWQCAGGHVLQRLICSSRPYLYWKARNNR